MIKSSFVHIVFFLYLYTISYSFLPFSTTVILGIFGFIWLISQWMINTFEVKIKKIILFVPLFLLCIGSVSVISLLINNTSDIKFISYVPSQMAILIASYFVIKVCHKLNYTLNFQSLASLLINIIFIQTIIVIVMFLSPEVKNFLLGLEDLTDKQLIRINNLSGFRLYGIGASKTFLAGIINGYALILIAIMIRKYKFNSTQLFKLSIKFLLIFLVGVMMARTTLLGALLALIILYVPTHFKFSVRNFTKKFLFASLSVILPMIIVTVWLRFLPEVGGDTLILFEFGFEILLNYMNTGRFETESTNELLQVFYFPTDIKTYLIGDGYFFDPNQPGLYYMHTDVGYLRLIYYFGIFGLMFYLSMQVFFIVKAYQIFGVERYLYLFIVCYFLILNLKGFTDLLNIHYLFIMAYVLNNEKRKHA